MKVGTFKVVNVGTKVVKGSESLDIQGSERWDIQVESWEVSVKVGTFKVGTFNESKLGHSR